MTPRTAVAASCLALVTALLANCGSKEEDATAEPSPTDSASASASESASPSSSESSSLSQDELLGAVAANAAPKDLVWLKPKPPASWREMKAGTGQFLWQVGDEPCTVLLEQPNGVGTAEQPTSSQVLTRQIKLVGQAYKATGRPQVTTDEVALRQQVVGLDSLVTSKIAHARVDYGKGFEADIRAYRAGDFALIASASCGKNRLEPVFAGGVWTFLEGIAARTTY